MTTLRAAFLFLSPDADSNTTRCTVDTDSVALTVVGVRNYSNAVDIVESLIDEGIGSIELCGGFGHAGAAMIAKEAAGRVAVGAVRFDCHPGLGGESGDRVFAA